MSHRSAWIAVAFVTLLVGCNKLNRGPVEEAVKESLASKGEHVRSVTCPDGLAFKEQTFECKAVDHAGKNADVRVTVKPTSGGKMDVRYSTVIEGKTYSN